MEKDSKFYDSVFRKQKMYSTDYKSSPYYVMWTQVIYFLNKAGKNNILEVGCGPGQFAGYLKEEGYENYRGFDFSTQAIKLAEERNPELDFSVDDALKTRLYDEADYDTIISLEVLEHIKEDREVLKNIPEGKYLIVSVPDFDSESHVRWFRSIRQVKKRYFDLVQIDSLVKVGAWYVMAGYKKEFKPGLLQNFLGTRESVGINSIWLRARHHLKNKLKLKSI